MSTKVPTAFWYSPTATQYAAETHDTPVNPLLGLPLTAGGMASFHRPPLRSSASGASSSSRNV